ncbi:MAG: hypothetical protein PHU71_05435 [Candidatus Gracilibacteria bacterium]|nr:hypothetical protein [Candidatus Gracilibacteria bacterium]
MLLENYLSGYDIADVYENEAGYTYFGYTRPDGSWRILRVKSDESEYRLAIGGSDYETAIADRASQEYRTSNNLPRL